MMRDLRVVVIFEVVAYFFSPPFPFCTAQSFLVRPEDAVINETGTAIFRCVPVENNTTTLIGWTITVDGGMSTTIGNGGSVSGIESVTVSEDRTNLTLANVSRSVNGATIICNGIGHSSIYASCSITVQYPPEYTLVGMVRNPLNLSGSVVVQFTVDGNPAPQDTVLTKDGDLVSSRHVAYSGNDVNITNLQCDDGGQYTLQSTNAAGVGSGNFMLNITPTPAIITDDAVVSDVIQSTGTVISLVDIVNGCPDNITVTCSLAEKVLFTAVVNVSENTTVTDPPRLQRSQFISDSMSEGGSITLCCTASNAVGNTSKDVTIRYHNNGRFESPSQALDQGEIAAIVLASVFTVLAVIVIFFCIGCCLKFKNEGN